MGNTRKQVIYTGSQTLHPLYTCCILMLLFVFNRWELIFAICAQNPSWIYLSKFPCCDGRVVKALDLKSNGIFPRRFEPCSQRNMFCMWYWKVHGGMQNLLPHGRCSQSKIPPLWQGHMCSLVFHSSFWPQNWTLLFPPGLEPGTFRVLGERDNHYTTETRWPHIQMLLWASRYYSPYQSKNSCPHATVG